MNNEKKLVFAVLDNNIKALVVHKDLTSMELLTELIDLYQEQLVGYHYNLYDAFETYYTNKKLFKNGRIDVKKELNKSCIEHLESCLSK